tara:strand:+ start:453 stop:773 length:321 start_codon:yes stop_codon:yes gene_type:complete
MENEVAKVIISEWLWIALILIGSNILKDMFVELSLGLAFYYDKVFNEGDVIYIGEESALIIKIGMRYSVFEITKPCGNVTWKYIRNSIVKGMALERVVIRKGCNKL